ncbi:MAG: hypothetical protein P8Z30_20530 [Acidobacteriota bacterium]
MPVRPIQLNSGNPPTAQPPSQGISKSAGDSVRWQSSSNNWSVDFEGNSPFEGRHFSPSNPESGPITVNPGNTQYKYSITVDGVKADPTIIVNP